MATLRTQNAAANTHKACPFRIHVLWLLYMKSSVLLSDMVRGVLTRVIDVQTYSAVVQNTASSTFFHEGINVSSPFRTRVISRRHSEEDRIKKAGSQVSYLIAQEINATKGLPPTGRTAFSSSAITLVAPRSQTTADCEAATTSSPLSTNRGSRVGAASQCCCLVASCFGPCCLV